MLDYFYLIITCIFTIELFLRFNFLDHFSKIKKHFSQVLHILISSNVSDHWKEKMVPFYAFKILKSSSLFLTYFIVIIIVLFAFDIISDSFFSLLISMKGVIFSFLLSFSYFKIKKINDE